MSAVREGAATERQIARWLASRGMPLGSDASGLPGASGGWDAGRLALSKRTDTHTPSVGSLPPLVRCRAAGERCRR